MFTIRKNVFETNSSSMHSVSYSPNKNRKPVDFDMFRKEHDGQPIKCEFGEFGWGYEILSGFEEKLSYVLTTIPYYDHIDRDDLPALAESKHFKWLSEILKETIGCELDTDIKQYDSYWSMGYVDHQSTDTLDDYFRSDEDGFKTSIIQLLFDDDYRIIIDNDNH